MPRPRFARAAPELREAILEVAALMLAAHGYTGASLNRILLASGLSKGVFYYYFDDKADLAATVLERELGQFDLRDLRVVKTKAAFWAEVERFSHHGIEQMKRSRHGLDVITRLGAAVVRDPGLLARCGGIIAHAQAEAAKFWQHGQAIGAVRRDLPVMTLIAVLQACKSALTAAFLPAERAATVDELTRFTEIYLDLVRRMV